MEGYRSTGLERSSLTFCVEGLPAREELLFKSFVRLLDHLTHQRWSYHAPAADARVDLLVVPEGVQPTVSQCASHVPQAVLRLGLNGAGSANGHGFLAWPLNPAALEKELNRLGALVGSQRGTPQEPTGLTVDVTPTPNARIDLASTEKLMRLLKWPPTHLLAGTGRMRLATLLTSKTMSLEELVRRSALPLPVCEAFVNDLLRANLLVAPSAAARAESPRNAPVQKAAQRGLLDRIRMRLGISA